MKVQFKLVVLVGIVIFFAALLGALKMRRVHQAENHSQFMGRSYADSFTRQSISTVQSEDIANLSLEGIHIGRFADSPIKVSDTDLIRIFIYALRSATTNSLIRFGDGVDTLQLNFKKSHGTPREPLRFSFNAQSTNHWYGADFKQALLQLSRLQAQQVQQRANQITSEQIKSAQFGSIKVTEPQKLQALLKALQNVDEHAYAYTQRTTGTRASNFETLQLQLRNGKTVDFRFVPSLHAPNATAQPLWDLYERQSNSYK